MSYDTKQCKEQNMIIDTRFFSKNVKKKYL